MPRRVFLIMRLLRRFCRVCEGASLFISRIAAWLCAAIVAVMIFEVVSRYVFDKPTLWANELSLWLAGILYLFAGLYAMRERAHIRVTILYDALPPRGRRALDFLAMLVVVAFAALLVFGSFDSVWQTVLRWERFGTAWNPPIPATLKGLVLIVTVLIAVQAVSNFIANIVKEESEGGDDNKSESESINKSAGESASENTIEKENTAAQ